MQKINCIICDHCRKVCTESHIKRQGKKKTLHYCSVECLANSYPTKYKEGFLLAEEKEIVKLFPQITEKEYFEKLGVNTCTGSPDGTLTYHCDVIKGLNCALEHREQNILEWD